MLCSCIYGFRKENSVQELYNHLLRPSFHVDKNKHPKILIGMAEKLTQPDLQQVLSAEALIETEGFCGFQRKEKVYGETSRLSSYDYVP